MSSLKQKSITGIVWNMLEVFGIQAIKFVLGVILARLLMPKDYGLIGMVTVFFAVANTFIDSGFGHAYIQKKNATETDASTIFYFNLFISILIYGLLWLAAPLIANFYDQPQLIDMTRVMALILIINAIGIIQIAKLTKEVDFKKKTMITLTGSLISGGAGITAALSGLGVWSLVIQSMVNAFVKNVGLWFIYKWKPLFVFNIASLKSMFSFSSWVLLTGIIRTVFDNIYLLIIGKFFPAAELGFYTKARQFQRMVSQQPSNAVGKVAFPVFATQQDDKVQLKRSVSKFSRHSMFFIAPICAILIVVADPFITLLLTEKWTPMVPYFQLLCVAGFFYPWHMVNVQVLTAQGKTNLNFRIALLKNALRVINIAIMYRFGVVFIIYGEILISLLALFINAFYTKRLINYGIFEQFKDLWRIVFVIVILISTGLFFNSSIQNVYLQMIVGVFFTGIMYIGLLTVLDRELINNNVAIIKEKIKIRRQI